MKSGVRVIRGPDWKWDDQDGGEGFVGTVVRPTPVYRSITYHSRSSNQTVNNGTVFVQWDSGFRANYHIEPPHHDLRVLSSACAGIQHRLTCSVCGVSAILGTCWHCNECTNCDLCDECYHNDKHELSHQFLRIDAPATPGVLVPAREMSERIVLKGIYPGAVVHRSLDDFIAQHCAGRNIKVLATSGSVLIAHDEDDAGESQAEKQSPKSPRDYGCVRVMWDDGDITEPRRGLDGKVEVYCLSVDDVADGGFCYHDHLAVLDGSNMVMTENTDNELAGDVSDDDDVGEIEGAIGKMFESSMKSLTSLRM